MKRVIELLKESGTVGRIQKHFNLIKPPVGTSDETIINAIRGCVCSEMLFDKKLEQKFFDAMMQDVAEALKDEMNIEFANESEGKSSTQKDLATMLVEILEIINNTTRKE